MMMLPLAYLLFRRVCRLLAAIFAPFAFAMPMLRRLFR